MRTESDLVKLVNASGFPLQLAVEREVGRAPGWRIQHREHAWTKGTTSGFADLIAENDHNTVAIFECKRVRESDWVFIVPENSSQVLDSRIYVIYTESPMRSFTGFFDARTGPEGYEADYCVMVGDDAKSRPLLERTAAEVTIASEAIALEEFKHRLQPTGYGYRSYIPVIVTTARLSVCAVDEEAIDLSAGEIGPSHASIKEVPWVRFRKQFTDDIAVTTKDIAWDARAISKAKEKVVYVVNSIHLKTFLCDWKVYGADVRRVTSMLPRNKGDGVN
ncbi:hypothetical protein [Luteimonas saliphila]|uniref:hypothetical protein n=1 Tax=Luteimonas saliphila TaxID=2804919 RepID=UPI00192DB15F|nr:hypothetical protein [Luteimonas saliphila]